MTKIEALKKSIQMWIYIRDNKLRYKHMYFYKSDSQYVENGCYLCAYTTEKNKNTFRTCDGCINWNKYNDIVVNDCLSKFSPYYDYHNSNKYAYEIADDMLYVLIRELDNEINNVINK